MTRTNYGILGVIAVAASAGAYFALRHAATPSPEQQLAMVDRYCTECHNSAELAGGLSLDGLGAASIHSKADAGKKSYASCAAA